MTCQISHRITQQTSWADKAKAGQHETACSTRLYEMPSESAFEQHTRSPTGKHSGPPPGFEHLTPTNSGNGNSYTTPSPPAKQFDEKTDSGWSSQDESETNSSTEFPMNRSLRSSVSSEAADVPSEQSSNQAELVCLDQLESTSRQESHYYSSEYTWMSDQKINEARMMAEINKIEEEEEEDLEELYYWDAVRGCDGDACGKSKVMAYRREQERLRDLEIDAMRARYEETMTLRQQYTAKKNRSSAMRRKSSSSTSSDGTSEKPGCGYTFLADARNIPQGSKTTTLASNKPVYFDVVYEDRASLNPGAQSFIPRK